MTSVTKFTIAAASALACAGAAAACGGVAVGAATGYGRHYNRTTYVVPAATYYPITVGASLVPAAAVPPLVQQQVQYDQPCVGVQAAPVAGYAPSYAPAYAPAYAAGVPVVTYNAPLVFRTSANYIGGYSYNTHAGFSRAFVPARQFDVHQRGFVGRAALRARGPARAQAGAGAAASVVLRNGVAVAASAPNQVQIRQGLLGGVRVNAR